MWVPCMCTIIQSRSIQVMYTLTKSGRSTFDKTCPGPILYCVNLVKHQELNKTFPTRSNILPSRLPPNISLDFTRGRERCRGRGLSNCHCHLQEIRLQRISVLSSCRSLAPWPYTEYQPLPHLTQSPLQCTTPGIVILGQKGQVG